MISTIIFDMDGVIIDSQSVLDVLEIEFLKRITNKQWSKQDQHFIHGKTIPEVYKYVTSTYGIRVSKTTFLQQYKKILNITYSDKCRLNPGIQDFLESIRLKKYNIALASSTSYKYIYSVLERFGLTNYFQIIVSSDESKSKPEPDIFLLTASKLGVKPEECVVIEDSNNGIKAAKRAGMLCMQYVNKTSGINKYADVNLKSYKGQNIQQLVSKLQRKNIEVETITLNKKKYYFTISSKVNKTDYYSDFLLKELIILLKNSNGKKISILEIGTGRGFIPIVVASLFSQVNKIVGVDIDKTAVYMANMNVWLNGYENTIEIRKSNLYSAIKRNEIFDFIISAPPQIPISKKELLDIIQENGEISAYHITTSYGGTNGQLIVKKLIAESSNHIHPRGYLIEVQADFSFSRALQKHIEWSGFETEKIIKKRKLLKETSLTKILEPTFKRNGYSFKQNYKKEKYFNLLCVVLRARSHENTRD